MSLLDLQGIKAPQGRGGDSDHGGHGGGHGGLGPSGLSLLLC
ncbi:MAG TPA: SapB/AmfS family lanthipeptide [Solirubrobacteraceae bacterium]